MDYLCQVKPNAHSKPYTLKQIDFLGAYVIPADVLHLIPAAVLLRGKQKKAVTILPEKPKHPERYKYEAYRESVGAAAACKKSKAADKSVGSARTLLGLPEKGLDVTVNSRYSLLT